MKDVQFEQTRKALQSKQRDLKQKDMGNMMCVFQILNFRRTISTYFQDVLFYSNYFCLLTAFLRDNLNATYFTRKPFQCNSRTARRLDHALFSFERK